MSGSPGGKYAVTRRLDCGLSSVVPIACSQSAGTENEYLSSASTYRFVSAPSARASGAIAAVAASAAPPRRTARRSTAREEEDEEEEDAALASSIDDDDDDDAAAAHRAGATAPATRAWRFAATRGAATARARVTDEAAADIVASTRGRERRERRDL